MRIHVVGSGYVGLVTAACLAEVGHDVVCIDIDKSKIDMLNDGAIPIHEPGLETIVARNSDAGRLSFRSDFFRCADAEAVFIAVGTPPGEAGEADLSYVKKASESIGEYAPDTCLVVVKSTVPVGTSDMVEETIAPIAKSRGVSLNVAFNPEFLREGAALNDFLKPDRIVIGVENDESETLLRRIYAPFNRNRDRMQVMDRRSAELTKYAANCMLAVRISFMNDLARLCEVVDADIEKVRHGIGSDPRIGPHFLYAGIGYGGSCFPKDVKALMVTTREHGLKAHMVEAAHEVNISQRQWFIDRIIKGIEELKIEKPRVAIWGLAFKPGTDDMREAPSIDVINALLDADVEVSVFDPAAMGVCRDIWGESIEFCNDPMAATESADVLVVITEWLTFREPDWNKLSERMRGRLIFDARNIYNAEEMAEYGFTIVGIGRGKTL